MASKPTQTTRIGSLTTALGKDKLVLTRFEASEGLSQLFEFTAEALSDDVNIDFNPAIGEKCCVSLKTHGDTVRHFHGILVGTQWLGAANERYAYRLRIRPWFWLLTQTSDCRIFKDMSVPDILRDVFNHHGGFAKFETSLSSNYPQLKYCVQYRESDYQFACRLMEEFGIYYYFRHSEDSHVMVLSDGLSSHKPKTGGEKLTFRKYEEDNRHREEHVFAWIPERSFNTGKVIFNDFDYKKPKSSLLTDTEKGGGYQNDKLVHYDYPGRYKEESKGKDLALVRLQSSQAMDHRFNATGDAPHCAPGALVSLAEHPEPSQNNKRFLVVNATHSYTADTYRTSGSGGGGNVYSGNYEFLPADIPFRAPQITPKPRIYGPQTAIVCGSGEIDVDEDGCITVQFHWDRDKKPSRKVRLAQVWAGKNWGGIYIPRVGMEVVVEFMEGDPDRPLVVGAVYNSENTHPYKLPKDKTLAGVKSKTDGGSGYNEFVFDDKKGSELVRMHAERDHEMKIENDQRRDIGNDISVKVGNNQTMKIGNVLEVTAQSKIEFKVGQSKIVMDPMSITIESSMIKIKASMMLDESSPLTTVKGDGVLILKGGVVLIN